MLYPTIVKVCSRISLSLSLNISDLFSKTNCTAHTCKDNNWETTYSNRAVKLSKEKIKHLNLFYRLSPTMSIISHPVISWYLILNFIKTSFNFYLMDNTNSCSISYKEYLYFKNKEITL